MSDLFVDLTGEEEGCCPVCSAWVPVAELQAHCEAHFVEGPSRPASPAAAAAAAPAAAGRVACSTCGLSVALAELDSHMLAHELERDDLEAAGLAAALEDEGEQVASREVRRVGRRWAAR